MNKNKIPVIQFTKSGYEKLKTELIQLEKEREEVIERLQKAREQGDLSENGAYKAARFELGDVDRQLRITKYQLRYGKVVEKSTTDKADFGSTIIIDDGNKKMTFTLVGGYESDPIQHKLSTISPIGKAVLGKKVGDEIIVYAPTGERKFKVIKVS